MTGQLKDRIRQTEPARLAPPDLPRIRQRGRRRRLATRTTVTVGTLALVALAVGGVAQFVVPSPPIEPAAPTVENSPVEEEPTMAALAAEFDMRVMRITWTPEAFTGFTIEQITPGGDTADSEWEREPGHGDLPVVTPAGLLWDLSRDGRTVLFDPDSGNETTAATSTDGLGWLPLAATQDGDALVTSLRLDPEPSRPDRSMLRRLTADGDMTDVPGVDDAVEPGEFIGLAAASPDGVALGAFTDGASRVVVLVGGEEPVTAMAIDEADTRLIDVAFVGQELWTLELDMADGTTTLHRFALDGTAIDAVPLDLDGPVAWRMTVSPDASHVTVPVGPRASTPMSYVVDVDAVRDGSSPADAAWRVDHPGVIHILPTRD